MPMDMQIERYTDHRLEDDLTDEALDRDAALALPSVIPMSGSPAPRRACIGQVPISCGISSMRD